MRLNKLLPGGLGLVAAMGAALFVSSSTAKAAEGATKRPKADSRSTFVHRIPLKDEDGKTIRPTAKEPKGKPYSPAQTCGSCHEYDTISHGWHFNAAEAKETGRPGEPWILLDATTRTQLPLSYRGWAGTYKPADIGLTDWQFTTEFARHLPGGGMAETGAAKPADPKSRWHISGRMNIDCLVCHTADTSHDPNERAKQLAYENFKWAPTVALGLAAVKGTGTDRFAKNLPADWDAKEAAKPDSDFDPGPQLHYDLPRFDAEGLVSINITKKPPASRCYYCHTTQPAVDRSMFWHSDRDVHVRAGFLCVDCHRNGIDHSVVRGYEQEGKQRNDAMASSLSCRGCHLGVEGSTSATVAMGGRLGAPRPHHVGLPPVHLEKLACTACHSGPFPGETPEAIHTSLAHALGYETALREPKSPPGILAPVFLRGEDGKIAPHKMVWPNFWGRLHGEKVTPMLPAAVQDAIKAAAKAPVAATTARPTTQPVAAAPAKPLQNPLTKAKDGTAEGAAPLSDQQVLDMLQILALQKDAGEPVYISGGKMYRRAADGKLTASEHAAAKPYAWALGHDVRPATQSLGARGCNDCHVTDAPIYFAKVTPPGPAQLAGLQTKAVYEMRGDDGLLATLFDLSFIFRPVLKIMSFGCVAIIGGVLTLYGLRGLGAVLRLGRED